MLPRFGFVYDVKNMEKSKMMPQINPALRTHKDQKLLIVAIILLVLIVLILTGYIGIQKYKEKSETLQQQFFNFGKLFWSEYVLNKLNQEKRLPFLILNNDTLTEQYVMLNQICEG